MKLISPRYDLHDALTLALANAEDESDHIVGLKDAFLSYLHEYGWNVTPLAETEPLERTNVQRVRKATRISNEVSDSRCSECGQGWCVHLEQASTADRGWRSDE